MVNLRMSNTMFNVLTLVKETVITTHIYSSIIER